MAVVPSLIGLVPSKIPFTFSICQCQGHAEMALKMGALQFSYVKPCTPHTLCSWIGVHGSKMARIQKHFSLEPFYNLDKISIFQGY
jgi:hypothetical protein